jgi:membrane associated rhomboid family serine protease
VLQAAECDLREWHVYGAEPLFVLPFNREHFYNRTPWIVVCLTVANTALLIATYASQEPTFHKYGFVASDPQLLNILTSMFLHAGFWHLIGNMFFLWMFGGQVENRLGPWLFSLLYLFSGIGAAWLHHLVNASSAVPLVGASGAISGIVGAYFVFFPKSRFDLEFYLGWWNVKTIRTRTPAAVGAWFGEQFLLGLITLSHGAAIAFWAHVGGFLVGLVMAAGLNVVVPARAQAIQQVIPPKDWENTPDDEEGRLKSDLTILKL